ncbi:unnamed protein product [Polarella glacialis]|uniref:Uncharacterized protein n=1 Tax=Polarella glacialis TaxID=89957 RepID=A0A813JBD7_POLGL|nr:unnamed protein product [Polarella glacialis]
MCEMLLVFQPFVVRSWMLGMTRHVSWLGFVLSLSLLLFIVCCLLSAVLLFIVIVIVGCCCLLFIGCCVSLAVCCLLFAVCHRWLLVVKKNRKKNKNPIKFALF